MSLKSELWLNNRPGVLKAYWATNIHSAADMIMGLLMVLMWIIWREIWEPIDCAGDERCDWRCLSVSGPLIILTASPSSLSRAQYSQIAEGSYSVCFIMVDIFIITTINNKVEYVSEFYGLETFIAILYNHGIKHGRKRFFEIIDFYCE